MSILENILTRGYSQATRKGFANWLGRRLALRHKEVKVAADTAISPGAMVCPRQGRIEIGAGSMICSGAMVQGNVRIGNNSSVQNYTVIVGYGEPNDTDGLVSIGNNVRIAPHCMLIAANHNFQDASKPISGQGITSKPITIEDDVWIGGNVNIMAGVTIGNGSVIGAGSVVTKDIPSMSIAVGTPAKVIKARC